MAATVGDLNIDALAALGDNPQGDIDTMFILLSGFMVRFQNTQAFFSTPCLDYKCLFCVVFKSSACIRSRTSVRQVDVVSLTDACHRPDERYTFLMLCIECIELK